MLTFLEFTRDTGPKNTAADHDDIAKGQRKNSERLGSIQLVVSVNENDERCQEKWAQRKLTDFLHPEVWYLEGVHPEVADHRVPSRHCHQTGQSQTRVGRPVHLVD